MSTGDKLRLRTNLTASCFNIRSKATRRATQTYAVTKLQDCFTQHHVCCGMKKIQTEPPADSRIATKNVAVGIALLSNMKGTNTRRRNVSPPSPSTNNSKEKRSSSVSTQTKALPKTLAKHARSQTSTATKETQYFVPNVPKSKPQSRDSSPKRRDRSVSKDSGSGVTFVDIDMDEKFEDKTGKNNTTKGNKIYSPSHSPKMNARKNRNIYTSKDTAHNIVEQKNTTKKIDNQDNNYDFSKSTIQKKPKDVTKIKKNPETEHKAGKIKRIVLDNKDVKPKLVKRKEPLYKTEYKKPIKKPLKPRQISRHNIGRRNEPIMTYHVSPFEKIENDKEISDEPMCLCTKSDDHFSNINAGHNLEEKSGDIGLNVCVCNDDLEVYQVKEEEDVCLCAAIESNDFCAVEQDLEYQCCCFVQEEPDIYMYSSLSPEGNSGLFEDQRDSLAIKRQQSYHSVKNQNDINPDTNGNHYRGDNCSLTDPFQREKEIRRLLGVDSVPDYPHEEQPKQVHQVQVQLSQRPRNQVQPNQGPPKTAMQKQGKPKQEQTLRETGVGQASKSLKTDLEKMKTICEMKTNRKNFDDDETDKVNGNQKLSATILVPSSILTGTDTEENLETRTVDPTATEANLNQSAHSYVEMITARSTRIIRKEENTSTNSTMEKDLYQDLNEDNHIEIENYQCTSFDSKVIEVENVVDKTELDNIASFFETNKSDEIEIKSTDYVVFETVGEGKHLLPNCDLKAKSKESQNSNLFSVDFITNEQKENKYKLILGSNSGESLKKTEDILQILSTNTIKTSESPSEISSENNVSLPNAVNECILIPKSPQVVTKGVAISQFSYDINSPISTLNITKSLINSDKNVTHTSSSFAVVYENHSHEFISTSSIAAQENEQTPNDKQISDIKLLIQDPQSTCNYTNKEKTLMSDSPFNIAIPSKVIDNAELIKSENLSRYMETTSKKKSPINIPVVSSNDSYAQIIKSDNAFQLPHFNIDLTKTNYFPNETVPKSVSFDQQRSNDLTNIFQFTSTKNNNDLNYNITPQKNHTFLSENSKQGNINEETKYNFGAIKASFENTHPLRTKNRNIKLGQNLKVEDGNTYKRKSNTLAQSKKYENSLKSVKDLNMNQCIKAKAKYDCDYNIELRTNKKLPEITYSQHALSVVDEESKISVNNKSTTLDSLRAIPKYNEKKLRHSEISKKFESPLKSRLKCISISKPELQASDNLDGTDDSASEIESTASSEMKSTSSTAIHSPTESVSSSLEQLNKFKNTGKPLESKPGKITLQKSPIKFFRKLKAIISKKTL